MEKEFVPFAESVELRNLGFDELSIASYYNDGEFTYYLNVDGKRQGYNCILAPLYQQAFGWLYKKTNKWIIPIPNDDKIGEWYASGISYKTYEEAEIACLRKLIEIVKEQNKTKID